MISKLEHFRILLSKIFMYAAIIIVLFGMFLHVKQGVNVPLQEFTSQYAWHPKDFWQELTRGSSYAILMLGILILMVIPAMRLLLYVVEFALKKNRLYLGISLSIVLIILCSFLLGK